MKGSFRYVEGIGVVLAIHTLGWYPCVEIYFFRRDRGISKGKGKQNNGLANRNRQR